MLSSIEELEADALYTIREVYEQFDRPALLFSGGKDSLVLLHLARKALLNAPAGDGADRGAVAPAETAGRLPIPVLHIDTGHNFPEILSFRDRVVAESGAQLIVRRVQDTIDAGRVPPPPVEEPSRNRLQSVTLLDAIAELGIDAALGGGRRDEEKARAKERVFSARGPDGIWDPHLQRPELWQSYVASRRKDEHYRVFPLSDWTELDVWRYIENESLDVPGLYFSHPREVIERKGILLPASEYLPPHPNDNKTRRVVRFRTVGDLLCSGAVASEATTVAEIIADIVSSRRSERSGRLDDAGSESAMEDRKREGYF